MAKQTKYHITIKLKGKKALKYKKSEVKGFEVMSSGYFYLQLNEDRIETPDKLAVNFRRMWFPLPNIDYVEIHQSVVFEGEVDVIKYHKFRQHGIDPAFQAVSFTAPPDEKEVRKKVNKDKHVLIAVEKDARKKNKKN